MTQFSDFAMKIEAFKSFSDFHHNSLMISLNLTWTRNCFCATYLKTPPTEVSEESGSDDKGSASGVEPQSEEVGRIFQAISSDP